MVPRLFYNSYHQDQADLLVNYLEGLGGVYREAASCGNPKVTLLAIDIIRSAPTIIRGIINAERSRGLLQ